MVPGGPDSELSVINAVEVLAVAFVDSVELERVEASVEVELLNEEVEITFVAVLVTLRLASERLSFLVEDEMEAFMVELLDEELESKVSVALVTLRYEMALFKFELLDEEVEMVEEFERVLGAVLVMIRLVWETVAFSLRDETALFISGAGRSSATSSPSWGERNAWALAV